MKLTELHTHFSFPDRFKKSLKSNEPPQETAPQILARIRAAETSKINFKIKKRETRAKYYDLSVGINNPNETLRLSKIFDEQGFTYTVSPENEISNLDWETKEQDFAAFSVLIQRIRNTVHLSDEEYRDEIHEIIYELVDNSPLYARLNNDGIRRSEAHVDNPLQHTIAVCESMVTTGLNDPWKIFWTRLGGVEHDLLKIGIAIGDHTNLHAEGYKIWKEYFVKNPLQELNVPDEKIRKKLIDQFLLPVRYHHLPEVVQYGIVSEEEAYSLIMYDPFSLEEHYYLEEQKQINPEIRVPEPVDCLFMLGVLSSADAASVDRYIPYAVANAARFFAKIVAQLPEIDWDNYPKEYFVEVSDWLYQMFLITVSDDPAALLTGMRNLKDPVLQSKDFKYGETQIAEAKDGYFEFAKFARKNGILQ